MGAGAAGILPQSFNNSMVEAAVIFFRPVFGVSIPFFFKIFFSSNGVLSLKSSGGSAVRAASLMIKIALTIQC